MEFSDVGPSLSELGGELDSAEMRVDLSSEAVDDYYSRLEIETEARGHAVDALHDAEVEIQELEAYHERVANQAVTEELEMQTRLVECNRIMEETALEYEEQERRLACSYNDLEGLERAL